MADLYGPTPIPLTASGRDDFLHYTVSFFQAVANANAILEWKNIAPNASKVVTTATTFDPRRYIFNEAQLPLLSLHRLRVADRADTAQCIRTESGELLLTWVPFDATPETARHRSTFAAKLFQTLEMALENGRDPSWKVVGDTYYDAQTYGSVIARFAKFRRLHLREMKVVDLKIPGIDSSTFRNFEAYECKASYELEVTIDPGASFGPNTQVDMQLQVPGDPPLTIAEFTLD